MVKLLHTVDDVVASLFVFLDKFVQGLLDMLLEKLSFSI